MTTDNRPDRQHEVVGRRVPAGNSRLDDFTYSVVEMPAERRGPRRSRTRLREGLLSERPGRPPIQCRILDQSTTGAKLQLHDEHPLPRSFLLNDAAQQAQFRATLVWQKGRDAGVRLEAIVREDAGRPEPKRPFFR